MGSKNADSSPAPDGGRTVELRLRAAVEAAQSGILMIDASGHIVLVNREVERLFGYAREELLGKPVDMLVPERLRAEHVRLRAEFVSDPRMRAMGEGRDLHGVRKDGVQVPVEIGLAPVVTEEGMFVLASIMDVSARRRAEERFRTAVESSPNGMVMIDKIGHIVLVNREVERMFGYTRQELLGQSIEQLVPERFRERHPFHRDAFFAAPTTREMGAGRDLFGLHKNGSEIPVEIGLNPIETDEGLLVLGSIVDISSRKRAEVERRRLENQLRHAQKMEAVGTLASGVAHDFNNILGAIIGYAELIKADLPAEGSASEDLDALLKAADRGRQLIERILTFSRRQESVRRPVVLGAAIRDAAGLLRATLPASIQMRISVDPEAPRVLADQTSLQQVLMNLANNASQAMHGGGILDISVESEYLRDSFVRAHPELHEGPYALLSVRDSGHGMDRSVLDRAFEPFFTTKEAGDGTGLGLSMVMAIMRDHDGLVEIESEIGRGTTVRCYFPAIDLQAHDAVPPLGPVPRGAGQRVLLVDDEPDLALIGGRRLTALGYKVTVVSNCSEAAQIFQASPDGFDAVVTDYFMPVMTGLELAEHVHALRPGLPILMMTGVVESLPPDGLDRAGVRCVVSKPLTTERLAAAMQHLFVAGV